VSGERLRSAHSPYLALHADDPVDWHPWGPGAFEDAASRDVPVFLSVGYSSCHWCHVMQRESFRDAETAEYLNDHFVCVKVDREERPDVDALYMDYVNATAGHGGWPMTVFLTPQMLPVLGGTYFPKHAPEGMSSFMEVLEEVSVAFVSRPDSVEDAAEFSRRFLEDQAAPSRSMDVTPTVVEGAAHALAMRADGTHGGFGGAPKFPMMPLVSFLLRFGEIAGDGGADQVARQALQAMVRGGIYDQAGGGLFRYATDASWLVPHFEKMLYDNALLLSALARAHTISPDDEFAFAMGQTSSFLEREMVLEGGIYAASLSAETGGVEGATYTWTYEELADALSDAEFEIAERHLGVEPDGVWEGVNILTRRDGRESEPRDVDATLMSVLEARLGRAQPDRDAKTITSWNGMAAAALIEAGDALDDDAIAAQGRRVLDTLLAEAWGDDGVVHVLNDEAVASVRLLEDYAHLAAAALSAYEVLGEASYLDAAGELHDAAIDTFCDEATVFMTSDTTDLPVRPRERSDSPTPSGASTLALNGMRLAEATSDETHAHFAGEVLGQWVGTATQAPLFAGTALEAMLALTSMEG
jgi:uncharacterized protein YyaL (SSP411 family)